MMMMMIIALKGAIRDLLQSPHCAANCLKHVRLSGLGAIVCKSRAAHRALITHNMCATWYEGTAQLLSLTEFQSHLFEHYFIGWTINWWRMGRNRSTRRKLLATSFSIVSSRKVHGTRSSSMALWWGVCLECARSGDRSPINFFPGT